MMDVLQVHPCKENRKKMLTKRTGTGKVPQDKSCYNLGQNGWKICTLPAPKSRMGKLRVLALRGFILDFGGGGGGGLLFHFFLSKIVVRIIMNKNYYGLYKAKAY